LKFETTWRWDGSNTRRLACAWDVDRPRSSLTAVLPRWFLIYMKRFGLALLFASVCSAQMAVPRIGAIQVFGAHHIGEDKILQQIGVKVGDPLPRSKGDAEEKLEEMKGVVLSRLDAFCCEDGKPILYIGIVEKGAPTFEYRTEPGEPVTLPDEIVETYGQFTEALHAAAREGEVAEDLSRGYSLMSDDPTKAEQLKFLDLAKQHVNILRKVLMTAEDPAQRSIAAYVIGYAPQSQAIVNDLQQALRDPDDSVRANAAQSLKALAVFSQNRGNDEGFVVRPTWFIEMLNSVSYSDRVEGVKTLVVIYPKLSDQGAQQVRDRALPALQEMAAWHYLPHALPAYLLLGRVAGIPDEELQQAWQQGQREQELKLIQKKLFKK
jgi:hypothetical protein